MRFTVGYPLTPNEAFVRQILENRDRIAEVYFAFGTLPNGRGNPNAPTTPLQKALQTRQLAADLQRFADAGIGLNLLLNGNCYGKDALSRQFFMGIGDIVDELQSTYGLSSVTATSPLVGKFIHANFPEIEVRASVNMGIGEVCGMDYVADCFDSFYLKREYNRNMAALTRAKSWCDNRGKKLFLLANSGCLNHCSAHTFHDNLVAHEQEIAAVDNAYQFSGICKEYLKQAEKRLSLVRDMNYIRPEDMHLYEGLVCAAKLATRVHSNPVAVLDAYLQGKYRGPVTSLLEPDNGSVMLPEILDNSRFPADFGQRVATCDKNCDTCNYCEQVYKTSKINLGGNYANQSND